MATRKSDPGPNDVPVPSSARTRSSGPAPSTSAASGPVRNALAAVRNFEALVRSTSVDEETLASVMTEIGGACATLRDAFLQTPATYDRLARFALQRVDELDALLGRGMPSNTAERVALGTASVSVTSAELSAAAELLDLAERSLAPASIELSLSMLAKESLQMVLALRTEATADVHIAAADPDAVVVCDPQIASRLIAIAVSMVYRPSDAALLVSTSLDGDHAVVRVEPRDQPASPRVAVRVLRLIDPTEDVAVRAAAAAGMSLARDGDAVVLTIPLQ